MVASEKRETKDTVTFDVTEPSAASRSVAPNTISRGQHGFLKTQTI